MDFYLLEIVYRDEKEVAYSLLLVCEFCAYLFFLLFLFSENLFLVTF